MAEGYRHLLVHLCVWRSGVAVHLLTGRTLVDPVLCPGAGVRLVLCQRFGDWTCTWTPAWHSECCRPFLACRAAASGVCSSGRVTPAAFATSSEPSRNSRASKTMDGSTQAPLPVPLGGVLPFSILGGLAFPFSELGHSQIGSALSTGSLASSSPCLVPLHATAPTAPVLRRQVLARFLPWTFPPGLTSACLHTYTWRLAPLPTPGPQTLRHLIYRQRPVRLPEGRVLYRTLPPQSPAQGRQQQVAVEERKDPGREGQREGVPPARRPGACGRGSPWQGHCES